LLRLVLWQLVALVAGLGAADAAAWRAWSWRTRTQSRGRAQRAGRIADDVASRETGAAVQRPHADCTQIAAAAAECGEGIARA
jgi:hypothetical protein